MHLSIVVSYRNRPVTRVKRFLSSLDSQTTGEYELIFVDYGSSSEWAAKAKSACDQYPWARYIFVDVRGRYWNRSHAMNIGIKAANYEYILCTDIDLIFSPPTIDGIIQMCQPDRKLCAKVHLLPESFDDYENISSYPLNFPQTGGGNRCAGMVQVLHRDVFVSIGGFDEFYKIWGFEDNDLTIRCKLKGIEIGWIDPEQYPMYHQWHAPSSIVSSDYPLNWYSQMSNYFVLHKGVVERNANGWGELIQTHEYINEKTSDYSIELPFSLTLFKQTIVFEDIMSHGLSSSNKIVKIQALKTRASVKLGDRAVKAMNKLTEALGIPLMVNRTHNFPMVKSTTAMHEILLSLIHSKSIVDYYIDDQDSHVTFYIQSGNT